MTSTDFWSSYPNFNHNPDAPVLDEFRHLATQRGWVPGDKKYRNAWARCMGLEFSKHFGSDATKLECWQDLCREVRVKNIPPSIKQCRKALSHVWVNLVDLIDCRRTGKRVRRFGSKAELQEYSHNTGKIFPKRVAKAEGFIKKLLIDMF